MSRPIPLCCCLTAQETELFLLSGVTNDRGFQDNLRWAAVFGDWRPVGGDLICTESSPGYRDLISPRGNCRRAILPDAFRHWGYCAIQLDRLKPACGSPVRCRQRRTQWHTQ